jgi:hypothetical protein
MSGWPIPRITTIYVPPMEKNTLPSGKGIQFMMPKPIRKHLKMPKIIITVNDITFTEKTISGKINKLKRTIILPSTENRIKIIAINTRDIQGFEEKSITFHKTTTKGDNSLRDLVKSVFGEKSSWAVLIGIKDYSLQRNGMKPFFYPGKTSYRLACPLFFRNS